MVGREKCVFASRRDRLAQLSVDLRIPQPESDIEIEEREVLDPWEPDQLGGRHQCERYLSGIDQWSREHVPNVFERVLSREERLAGSPFGDLAQTPAVPHV